MFNFNMFGTNIIYKPYTSAQERDVLLYRNAIEHPDILDILRIVGVDTKELEGVDKTILKLLLAEIRKVSLFDENFTISHKCEHCGTVDTPVVDSKFFIEPLRTDMLDIIKQFPTEFKEENAQSYLYNTDIILDDLDIVEYEEMIQAIKDHQYNISFEKTVHCVICAKPKTYSIGHDDFLISSLSEESPDGFFNTYARMSYYGNYSKLDIDSMLPGERTILLAKLNELIKNN